MSPETMSAIRKAMQAAVPGPALDATAVTVFDCLPGLASALTPDGVFVVINRYAEHWNQLSRAQIIGRSLEDLAREGRYSHMLPAFERAARGEQVQLVRRARQGAPRSSVLSTLSPVTDACGKVILVVILSVPLSEDLSLLSGHDPENPSKLHLVNSS